MPKENRKRGRREDQKKRKRDHVDEETRPTKHKKTADQDQDQDQDDQNGHYDVDHEQSQYQDEAVEGVNRPEAAAYYGVLDEEEQEYFKRADDMLELNQFADPEERTLFLANVYKEANGKELKIASSQSCSRLMERLILLSNTEQLKGLFQQFSGHFLNLVQHRFASHCCEALFIHAAPIVTQEIDRPVLAQITPSSDPNQVIVSMEDLFLHTLAELDGYLGYLMTDRFASHVLRVLLVVLAGEPLEKPSNNKSNLQSKKKEKVTVAGSEKAKEWAIEKRTVPKPFLEALEKTIKDSVAGIDATWLRSLAEHSTGNPTLQLLLQLELSKFGKSRAKDETSIIHRLLPDDPIVEGTDSHIFISGLTYSVVGSRLMETIIQFAPGKLFKAIYSQCFKDRMGSLARNEIASYVAAKILERLSKEDLEEAARQIAEVIPNLVERNQTAIIKTLVERCAVRGVNTASITAQLDTAYGGPNGFEITSILRLREPSSENGKPESKHSASSPDKVHGSLLAQAMMSVPGPLSSLVFDSLLRLGTTLTLNVARDSVASRTLQAALKSPNASVIFRRKMIQQFYGHIGELALDPAGSHLIDAVWQGTHGLAFIRERIAEELAENEAALRESHVGRAVWRNWHMDLYRRRRSEWVYESRSAASNVGFMSFPEDKDGPSESPKHSQSQGHKPAGKHISAIELARQKHAANKIAQAKKEQKKEKLATKASTGNSNKGKGKAPVMAQ